MLIKSLQFACDESRMPAKSQSKNCGWAIPTEVQRHGRWPTSGGWNFTQRPRGRDSLAASLPSSASSAGSEK